MVSELVTVKVPLGLVEMVVVEEALREVLMVGETVVDPVAHVDAVVLWVDVGQKLPVLVYEPVGHDEVDGVVEWELDSELVTVKVPLGLVDIVGVEVVLNEVVTVKEVVGVTEPHVETVELGVAEAQWLPVFVHDPVGQGEEVGVVDWVTLREFVSVRLPHGVGV